jgi:hypothetical protein
LDLSCAAHQHGLDVIERGNLTVSDPPVADVGSFPWRMSIAVVLDRLQGVTDPM